MDTTVEPAQDAAAPPPPEGERRSAPRYRFVRRCLVWPEGSCAATQGWHCIAYDISAHGIGLAVPLPPRTGTSLIVEADHLPGSRPLRVRVIHVRPVAYVWFCGCELDEPLSDEEQRVWLSRPRS